MRITERMTITVAEVEVNDGYRVELTQLHKRTDYSPEQAQQLAAELTVAAAEAKSALDEHNRQVAERIASEPMAEWERELMGTNDEREKN
jgi:hypothetical protein